MTGKHESTHAFTEEDCAAIYRAIDTRRDVRSEFIDQEIDDKTLARLLMAAHHAPSVGFMQPWDFIVLRDTEIRKKVRELFLRANEEAKEHFEGKDRETYSALKLEGILETPLNLVITCDRTRFGKRVIGRTHMKEMDLLSTACAVQNFWLAARAEGIGVGWVSIFNREELKQLLAIPEHVEIVAYLCVGYVSEFLEQPALQKIGWQDRLPLEQLLHLDRFNNSGNDTTLIKEIDKLQKDRNS